MHICGLNKTTLLDYPGKVAATIFIGACNFRCPFCHNSGLVLHPALEPSISAEELLSFLKKRKGILDGVCVTGGEPTLEPELALLLEDIKELGYQIKLDTNGSRPDVLKSLVQNGLVDTVAMDIKSSKETYEKAAGVPVHIPDIEESVSFLMENNLDYEFRTTLVRELHTKSDILSIGQWLAGAKAYYLQAYKDSLEVLMPGFSSFSREALEEFQQLLLKTISRVEIRGID